ncbi:GIY-YIG nuclease family protein [Anoxybacterium hadale]|uniref:GIY-YIG nuclease family protein n=1 Tax=Anoxybacterium hadale TaxID=3408580 RepID=A0ACD1AEZ7_9FIRM|nr:GIY-YIG nuclease family protein [Clostridiales bacterium]
MSKNAEEAKKGDFVYIVECADGTLYTGWTTDLDARMASHNCGGGAKYTRGRGPVRLLYSECCEDKSTALRREHQIKNLVRADKFRLINGEREVLDARDAKRRNHKRRGAKKESPSI